MKKTLRGMLAAAVSAVMAISMVPAVPALADEGGSATMPADGLYEITDLACDTGMVDIDNADSNAYLNVTDSGATLNLRVYTPNKYDYILKGTTAARPADNTDTTGAIKGMLIPSDADYAANGACNDHSFTDENGVVGAAGNTYKAVYFEIPVTAEEIAAGSVNFNIRYAGYYTGSKAGQYMGTADHVFTFTVGSAVSTDLSWGTTNSKSQVITYSLATLSTYADKVNAIHAAATAADTEAYADAVMYYSYNIDYVAQASKALSATYDVYQASCIYSKLAFPEYAEALKTADALIPNIIPADGTYEFLMNRGGQGNGYSCSSSNSDRLYSVILTVKDGKMTAQIAQRRGSYSKVALCYASEAALAETQYDLKELKSVYVDNPDAGANPADETQTFNGAGTYNLYTGTIPVESLEKPVICAWLGSSWYDRSFVLHEENMGTSTAVALARELSPLMNVPDPEDESTTTPAYDIDRKTLTAEQQVTLDGIVAKYNALSAADRQSFDELCVYPESNGFGNTKTYGDVLKGAYAEDFVATINGTEATDITMTESAYSYLPYGATEATKVNLYTVPVSATDTQVTLTMPLGSLVYNYDGEGNYLAGWVDDYTKGSTQVTVDIDSDKDGNLDYIQIQNPYNTDWSGADIRFAVTFKATINVPAAKALVYNGKKQAALADGTGYTVKNVEATNAGTYTATATLMSGYVWSDGTTAPKSVKFTVAKASQKITVAKTAKKAKKGKTTSAIKVTGAKTAKVFKKAGGSKFLTLTKAGKIKISKKAVKGKTYKIKVKVYAKNYGNYKASAVKTVTIKVKVK